MLRVWAGLARAVRKTHDPRGRFDRPTVRRPTSAMTTFQASAQDTPGLCFACEPDRVPAGATIAFRPMAKRRAGATAAWLHADGAPGLRPEPLSPARLPNPRAQAGVSRVPARALLLVPSESKRLVARSAMSNEVFGLLLLRLLGIDLRFQRGHHGRVAKGGDIPKSAAVGYVAQEPTHDLSRAGLGQILGP